MPFKIVRNDLTKMQVDVIVNPANAAPIYSLGTDMAVYTAAGKEELLEARRKIGFMEEGEAAITPGFQLPAKYIIHTVSPYYTDGEHGEEIKLRSCYKNSLKLAAEYGCKSIAFPLIATGSFRYPKEEGMRIALDEINAFLEYYKSRTFPCSYRNYCIILILAHYGLRAKDIADMKADQIDWINDTITVVTSKTKERIVLPLLLVVGNALALYLTEHRPKVSSPYVFLTNGGTKLQAGTISNMVRRAVNDSGVSKTNRRCGSHIFRSSLATRMMDSETPMLSIARSMGHASMNTTRIYAKVDIRHLKMCELEVPGDE